MIESIVLQRPAPDVIAQQIVALAVSTTSPASMTAAIFKALGCTVPEAAEPDRCARR